MIVATLVVQSTAMAITSDQLTNNTATTIAIGDQLKFELRRQQQQPFDAFECVQIIVQYTEPILDPPTKYEMKLTKAILAGSTEAESSFALTPGKFYVTVKADVSTTNPGIGNCALVEDDEKGQFFGQTEVIDFYSPQAQQILVVLLSQTFEALTDNGIADHMFDTRFAPVFTDVKGCPTTRVGKECLHTIEVETLNPAKGETPNRPVDGQYYAQFDYVRNIKVASMSYKFADATMTPLDLTDHALLHPWFLDGLTNQYAIDGSVTGNEIFATGNIDYSGGVMDFAYRTPEVPLDVYYQNAAGVQAPFRTKRVWNNLKISPKNLILLEVTNAFPDNNLIPTSGSGPTLPVHVKLTYKVPSSTTADYNGVLFDNTVNDGGSATKRYILYEYVPGQGDPVTDFVELKWSVNSVTFNGPFQPLGGVSNIKSVKVYPGTLDYTIKAYGNELDPSKANAFDDADKATHSNRHYCDDTADPTTDTGCATSEISLSASITNAAEVRIGAVVAYYPEIGFSSSSLRHVDTEGVTENLKTDILDNGAEFTFKVTDGDLKSTSSLQQRFSWKEELELTIERTYNNIDMPNCVDTEIGCQFETCPPTPGVVTLNEDFTDANFPPSSSYEGFVFSQNGADVQSTGEFDIEFHWKPNFECPTEASYVGKTECDNGITDANILRRLWYYGTTYCSYRFTVTDNTGATAITDNTDTVLDAGGLSSGTLLVMVRAHPVSSSYATAVANYKPPSVTFSSLALARIKNTDASKAILNVVRVSHDNVYGTTPTPELGVVYACDSDNENPLGLSQGADSYCCKTPASTFLDSSSSSPAESEFHFTYTQFTGLSGKAFTAYDSFVAHADQDQAGNPSTNQFYKLCIVVEKNLFPYKKVAILLDNSLEYGGNEGRRSARQLGDDSAENVDLPPSTQIFLDLNSDGVLTVTFDDQQQPVISVEPIDQVVPQKEVSTTSPQLEDENNTTEQITTTLLGLIIGAVLILLVIVVIAVMMLNKRKEAAAKVYPFWMPGTDVTKTTVQA